jgi:RND family efflux transporter MFP subunit
MAKILEPVVSNPGSKPRFALPPRATVPSPHPSEEKGHGFSRPNSPSFPTGPMKLSRGVLSLLTVLLLFVVLAAGVGWRILSAGAEEEGASRAQLPDTEGVDVESVQQFAGAQPVAGVAVIRDTLWVPVTATGRAEAYRRAVIPTRTSGVVEAVRVRENQAVQVGDLLVQLDTTEAAMELAQARAALTTAQVAFEERMLYAGDLLSEEEMAERARIVRATSGLEEAEVRVRRGEMELEWTRIRAPFAGRVADLHAVEGTFLSSGSEVLTLVQVDPLKVEVNVLEGELPFLAEGRRADVRFAGLPGEVFQGRVESVNPIVDPETSSARVTLVMSNPGGIVRPGMFARVSVDAQSYADRTLIPRGAVVERGEGRRQVVFMLRNPDEDGRGMAEWCYVTTGFRNETHVEIVEHPETSMLQPGEIVLVDGHHYLAHDTPVQLVEDVSAAGGRPGR